MLRGTNVNHRPLGTPRDCAEAERFRLGGTEAAEYESQNERRPDQLAGPRRSV